MPEYLLSVLHNYSTFVSPEGDELQAMYDSVAAFNDELQEAGAWVFAGGLEWPDKASVVDPTGDEPRTTDGPANDSAPTMGGMWIITAADRDAALRWATRGAVACGAPVEVRPFQGE
ncbi:YciI family protein [Demequina sp. NBRC 110051]|uniref:YciI family protein n=1 Tax=Demequina sp. NBRC 110051 TaxID=1570340 RepID=UPI000A06E14F|nr:YciI family protein [Demequina sp. NBRC 110051]